MTTATNNLPSDLNQLTVELKFYINQWGQNTIEIGKRLIAAKEIVGHGNWNKWLEDNFNLKERSARNFMEVAKRFGNRQTSADLSLYQMVAMLALPEGEIEKFIAEKTAEGKPPEDMTVKQLRAEVAEYKAELAKKNSEVKEFSFTFKGVSVLDIRQRCRIQNVCIFANKVEIFYLESVAGR